MKSAVVRAVIVPTTKALSAFDKVKVRTIVGAGLDLSVSVTRDSFESLYEKATTMPKIISEFVHVRKSRRKNEDSFVIIENTPISADCEIADESDEELDEEVTDYDTSSVDNLVDEMDKLLENMNSEITQEVVPPVVPQNTKNLSAVEQALADVQIVSNTIPTPIVPPMAMPTNETKTDIPIVPIVKTNNALYDADLDFVTFVYNKAIQGKYSKWTQNITVANVNEYAKLKDVNITNLINKYLVAHASKRGGIAYYSLKAKFVVKYYSKVCYASPDRNWFVVVANNTVELYRGDSKRNTLVETVTADSAPERYEKAIATLENYTFRQGVFGK